MLGERKPIVQGGPSRRKPETVLALPLEPVCRIAAESWPETQAIPASGGSDRVAARLAGARTVNTAAGRLHP